MSEGIPKSFSELTSDDFSLSYYSQDAEDTAYTQVDSKTVSKKAIMVYLYVYSAAYLRFSYLLFPGFGYLNLDSAVLSKNTSNQLTMNPVRIEYSNDYKTITFYKQDAGYVSSGTAYYCIYG